MQIKKVVLAVIAATALLTAGIAQATPGHGQGVGQTKITGKPGTRSGLIQLDQHIYYPGDTITVSVTIPSSVDGYWSGGAEAHLVVFMPDGSLMSVPIEVASPTTNQGIATLDTTDLPAGDYQLAFVLTIEGGDPTLLSDWYDGFAALISTQRARISEDPTDPADDDGDGEFDDDGDGDGYED